MAFLKVIQLLSYRLSHRGCFVKKLFLKISQYLHKITVLKSLFNKVVGLRPATLFKKAQTHKFSCEICVCEILRNTSLKNIYERLLLFLRTLNGYLGNSFLVLNSF